MMKKTAIFLLFSALAVGTPISPEIVTAAGEVPLIQYESGRPILDSDLDGLTDAGEKQLFGTDPANPDTDADGWFDGTEVLSQTDPNDASSPLAEMIAAVAPGAHAMPYAWYIGRAGGLLAFVLLYAVMFLGLVIRLPGLKRLIQPVYSLSVHHWLSLQALFFAAVHGFVFVFDDFIGFSVFDVLIPFVYGGERLSSLYLALGVLSLYGMIILVATSVWRRFISFWLWRVVHFVNIFVYVAVVVHALMLGTDLRGTVIRDLFIALNGVLAVLIIWNIVLKIKGVLGRRFARTAVSSEENRPVSPS
jgi:hypothetical protein